MAPDWQCPACGIAYRKYAAYLAAAKQMAHSVATPPRDGDAVPELRLDGSVWALAAVNLLALGVALAFGWSTVSLMAIYWAQSVVIGVSYLMRIFTLQRFSTENFKLGGQEVDPTPATKRKVAVFFAFHYGFFHLIYLLFITAGAWGETLFGPGFWACAFAFALNHRWSYRYNRDLDRAGTPNIGLLMFTPYVRILPMHLTIIFGGFMEPSAGGLLLFGLLKTAADVLMHVFEHSRLRYGSPPGGLRAG